MLFISACRRTISQPCSHRKWLKHRVCSEKPSVTFCSNGFQACAFAYPSLGTGLCDLLRSVLRLWWPTCANQLFAKHRTSSSARGAGATDFHDHCFGGFHSWLVGQHRVGGCALRHPHHPVLAIWEAQVRNRHGQEVSGHGFSDTDRMFVCVQRMHQDPGPAVMLALTKCDIRRKEEPSPLIESQWVTSI